MIVGNIGDCALFGVNKQGTIQKLTKTHNLDNQEELKDVIQRGGIVLKKGNQYRINA